MMRKGAMILEKYNHLPRAVKASFWFLVCSFLQRALSSVTVPIFTRLLTIEEYGQFTVFNSWMSIVVVFVSLQLYSGVYMQGLVKFEDQKNEFSSSLQGLTLTLVLVWTVIYLIFREFWNELLQLTTVQILAMLVIIWASSALAFWSSEQRVKLNYRSLVTITLAVSFARPIIEIILVLLAKDKVTARILGMMLVDVIAYTGLFFTQMKRGKKFFSGQFWKYAIRFNLPLIPHYLSMSILGSSDRIMISQMCGSDQAGIYSLAYSVSLIMTMFNTALLQTIEPWVYKKIKNKQIGDLGQIAYITIAFIAAINLVLILFAPEVVKIFAPAAYYEAIWVIPPVTMSVLFMFLYSLFAEFEFYYEKTVYIMLASMSGAALNIVLNSIFIRIFGYFAAGYTTLVCYIFFVFVHYLFMGKVCKTYINGQRPYSRKVLLLLSGGFVMCGIALSFTYYNTAVRYAVILLLAATMLWKGKTILQYIRQIFLIRSEEKNRINNV